MLQNGFGTYGRTTLACDCDIQSKTVLGYLMPEFGSLPMAAIDEKRVQEFIAYLTRAEYAVSKGKGKRKKLSHRLIG